MARVWSAATVLTAIAVLAAGGPAGGHPGGGGPSTTLNVTPNSDLASSQGVTVSGSGFGTSQNFELFQCSAAGTMPCKSLGAGTTSPSGTIDPRSVTVQRVFTASDASTVNCGQVDCFVLASTTDGSAEAHVHIAFRVPAAATGPAASVTSTGARLTGTVNPRGAPTNAFAEFSTSPTLASPSATAPVSMGSASGDVPFAADAGGLAPATTYYYRVVATWADGTAARGAIASFTTAAAPGTGGGGGPGGGSPGTGMPDATAPLITLASVRPTIWRIRRSGRSEVAISIARGTAFLFTLSEAGRVVFTIQRVLPGRRVGRLCRAPTSANRNRRRCLRYVRRGRFAYAARAGRNRKPFSGKIARRALAPGRYRARLVATDAAGNASRAAFVRFTVVRG